MLKNFLLLFIISSTITGCQSLKETDKLKKIEWLVGNWKGEANGQVFYENWEKVSDTEFSNINYSICNGDTLVNSRSKIELVNSKVAYTSGSLAWQYCG